MKHPHIALLETFYNHFGKKDWTAVLSVCSDSVTFQIPGKSRLAGKYTKDTFVQGLAQQLEDLSQGTFQLDVHDILASNLHATVLGTMRITRNGKTSELRTVQVWRFEEGKPVAWYEYPRDLYQYDLLWS